MPVSSATGPSCHPYVPARWWWQRRRQKRDILQGVLRCPITWTEPLKYKISAPWGPVYVEAGFFPSSTHVSGLPFALTGDSAWHFLLQVDRQEHIQSERARA